MKKNVIFLDIDGVLNSENSTDKIGSVKGISNKYIKILKDIVDIFDADLILTSSWKVYWDRELIKDGINNWRGSSKRKYGKYINLKLKKFGLYITDKTENYHWSKRAIEILSYLSSHPEIENYIILDDEDFSWKHFNLDSHWIDTSNEDLVWNLRNDGLKEEHIEYIKNNLEKFKR